MKKMRDRYLEATDLYNLVDLHYTDLVKSSFRAKYAGRDVTGAIIHVGDTIARVSGGYVLMDNE